MRLQPSPTTFLKAAAAPSGAGAPAQVILELLGLAEPHGTTAGPPDPAGYGTVVPLEQAFGAKGATSLASLRHQANTAFAGQIRALATGLSARAEDDQARTVVVASVADPADASRVSASLAVMCALGGTRVALIDGNLGHPRLHSAFGLSNEFGLSNLLLEQQSVQSLLQRCSVPNLAVMPAGPPVDGHASLLLREHVFHRIEPILAGLDMVIVDSATLPPGLVASTAQGASDVIVAARRHASSLRSLSTMIEALGRDGEDSTSVLLLD
jgi:Mrp family chromosome partitioning ATPase